MTSVPPHVTPLRLVQRVTIDLARAVPLLTDQAASWLGDPAPSSRPGRRRYLTDLSLPIREHAPSLVFRKAAHVDLGQPLRTTNGYEMDIDWQSSSLAPLFPVFAGRLTLTSTELRLEGYYAPPGGELGAVLDKVFLSIAARGTARWFLERTAEVLSAQEPVVDLQILGPSRADGSSRSA
jgi:hypothetical protein